MGEIGNTAAAPPAEVDQSPNLLDASQTPEPPVEGAFVIEPPSQDEIDAPEDEELVPMTTAFPTAAELEAIHQEAWQAGFEAGRQAGEEQGRAEGAQQALLQAAEQFESFWQPLQALQQSYATELAAMEAELAEQLRLLSVQLAEKIVGQVVQHDPGILRLLISDVLEGISQELSQARIAVNPEDMATLQAFWADGASGLRLQWVADASIVRGGCLIQTQLGRIDLSLPERMRRLRAALGVSPDA